MCFNHTSKQINEALMQHFIQDIVDFIACFFAICNEKGQQIGRRQH